MSEKLFDLEYYRVHRPTVRALLMMRDRSTPRDVERALAEYSAACGCHIIATFVFYTEAFGSEPWLERKVEFLLKWYQFSGFLAKNENANVEASKG